jgi:hypothetical protein
MSRIDQSREEAFSEYSLSNTAPAPAFLCHACPCSLCIASQLSQPLVHSVDPPCLPVYHESCPAVVALGSHATFLHIPRVSTS